jgi:hypothetical protein
MKASDIFYSLFIIIIFCFLYIFNILVVGIAQIQADWPLYKCNPLVMPFASVFGYNTATNFTSCIQNIFSSYIGYILQPIHYLFSVTGSIAKDLTNGLNDVRAFFDKIRNFITSIIQSVFGVFLNILIEFQRITIGIKDLFGKLIAVIVTLMYTVSGAIMTVNSAWNGMPGEMIRMLCFDPETKIKLKDDSLVAIKDVPLNAILKTGTRVCTVMNISNLDNEGKQVEKMYKVKGGGEEGKDIIVSGSHLVYDPSIKEFVHVEDLGDAEIEMTDLKCETLCCLITTDHTIPIGKWIFHDWEDNNGSPSKPTPTF